MRDSSSAKIATIEWGTADGRAPIIMVFASEEERDRAWQQLESLNVSLEEAQREQADDFAHDKDGPDSDDGSSSS